MVLDKQVHIASLGEYIELVDVRNTELHYGEDDVMGMTITKQIIPTKANVQNSELSRFWVVSPNDFIYNPRTHGKRIGLGFNDTNKCFLISWNNIAFRIKPNKLSELDPTYLFMNFNRTEWDRKACFVSWGSSTEVFTWEELCNIQIPLPGIEVQREYVAVYKAMQHNLNAMQNKLDDLKLVCDAYIEQLKDTAHATSVGKCIQIVDKFNRNRQFREVYGVNIDKTIIPTNADVSHVDISRYKILDPGNIVFSGMQTGRDHTIRIAMNTGEAPVIVSPAYTIFSIVSNDILPEYFMLWFLRSETDRLGWFLSDGSVRANLDIDRLFDDVEIPIPPIEVQKSIVAIYDVYNRRKQYAERLRQMINEMCPILVAASVGNTAVAAAHS